MKVGDTLRLKPYINADSGMVASKAQVCTVTYVHPEQRYYVVEFVMDSGIRFRQVMYFPEREGDMRRPLATVGKGNGARGHTNPENLKSKKK